MQNSMKKSLELKADVRLAYIKIFGEEKGKELIKIAEKKKAEIMKGRKL